MKRISENLFTILLILFVLIGIGCKQRTEIFPSKNLSGVEIEYYKFFEGQRTSWVINLKNKGENKFHKCAVILDNQYRTALKDIQIDTGFLGGFKKPIGTNTFHKDSKLEIANTSDFNQNDIFRDNEGNSYPPSLAPKFFVLTCAEGSELWEL